MAEEIGGIYASVGLVTAGDFDAQRARIEASLKGLESHYGIVGTAAATATTRVDAGMKSAGKEAGNFGYKLQVLGQGMDDLQYVGEQGLRPIINNLMQMSPVIGIAAIAFDQLIRRMGGLDGLMSTFGLGGVLTEAEHMEALGKKTSKTADDTKRLNEYRKEAQAIDTMMASQSKTERAVASGVQGVIAEADPETVLSGIIEGRMKDGRFLEDDEKFDKLRELQARRDTLKEELSSNKLTQAESMSLGAAGAAPGVREQKLATVQHERRQAIQGLDDEEIALRKEMYDRQKKEAQRLMLGAQKDPSALIAEAKKNPQFFPGNLVDELEKNTPGAIRNREIDKQTDEMVKRHRQSEKKDSDKFYGAWLKELEADEKAPKELEKEIAANLKDDEKRASLEEKGADLDWKLRQLMNPTEVGKTLGGEAYETSHHAMTGDSPELKKLHAIWEAQKEIVRNTDELRKLGGLRRIPR